VVIAGFGDTGLLTAIHLLRRASRRGLEIEVVGVSPKPCLVSGQELGWRIARPGSWKEEYLRPFDRYRGLDPVEIVRGKVEDIDPERKTATLVLPGGGSSSLEWDVLVIASGVTNGFWRNDRIEDLAAVEAGIERQAELVGAANSIAVVGGGATGVGAAYNLKLRNPAVSVRLFYGQELPLPGYHPRVRRHFRAQLSAAGVELHPGHRAVVPDGFACDRMTQDPVHWSTGQPAHEAGLVLWAIGPTRPNSDFVPAGMKDSKGYVRTDPHLRVEGSTTLFAVGDVAATDPNRGSARNGAYALVAHNVVAQLAGEGHRMRRYRPSRYRWGSVFGLQSHGLKVSLPSGGLLRFPLWSVKRLLFPLVVHRWMYKGLRRD
jgi:NADH dehydrogenase FAD-containing subunit